jgi:hypothetical protein
MRQYKLDILPKPVKVKQRHYLDLSINQKINLKANSAGFQSNWLKQSIPSMRKHMGFLYRGDRYEMLTPKWFWHHKVNNKHRIKNIGRLNLL